jgi:hypothetical protein
MFWKELTLTMPKTTVTLETQLGTRNEFTKIDSVITIQVDGRELPTAATLGSALEAAKELIQKVITESYVKIPERV